MSRTPGAGTPLVLRLLTRAPVLRTVVTALVSLPYAGIHAAQNAAAQNATAGVGEQWRGLTLSVFVLMLLLTLGITWFAARRIRAAAEFYSSGQMASGVQNGWAIAGDYLSAASFLGVVGLIAVYGFDGFLYAIGFLAAYAVVLLLIAEPCRNLGQYTLADILATRHDARAARLAAALSALVVSVLYLSAQLLGGGLVLRLLTGFSDEVCVVAVGVLTLAYVIAAGMATIDYVQVVKAVMLVTLTALLALLILVPIGFSHTEFMHSVTSNAGVQAQVTSVLGAATADPGHRFLGPGLFFQHPLDRLSLCLALVFGTAGLPHILMRFFAVPSSRDARQSISWAMLIIGGFYVITFLLGLAAAVRVGPSAILAFDPGGNMAVPLLAQRLGGGANSLFGNILLALTAAVALTTIIAVVSGLLLSSANAVAHDIFGTSAGRNGVTSAPNHRGLSILAALVVGTVAVILALGGRQHNVAHWVGLAFAVAASSNFPCLLLTLYWRRCTTAGVVSGMVAGTLAAVALILVSPNVSYPAQIRTEAQAVIDDAPSREALIHVLHSAGDPGSVARAAAERAALDVDLARAKAALTAYPADRPSWVGLAAPLFPLMNPGVLSMPIGFLTVILVSLLQRGAKTRSAWDAFKLRRLTGIHG